MALQTDELTRIPQHMPSLRTLERYVQAYRTGGWEALIFAGLRRLTATAYGKAMWKMKKAEPEMTEKPHLVWDLPRTSRRLPSLSWTKRTRFQEICGRRFAFQPTSNFPLRTRIHVNKHK